MNALRIAVIGAGTAGLASAAFLKQGGHYVTVYEKFDAPKSLGAGLLLQPTGLAVLARLGLDQEVIAQGSIIHQLYGKACGSRITTLNVKYRDYASHLFGLGIHRGSLFSALYSKVIALDVPIIAATQVCDVVTKDGKSYIQSEKGVLSTESYDLVIDSSGPKSLLRQKYAHAKKDKEYPYGAIWGVVKVDECAFQLNTLHQRYRHAHRMIGVLPIGQTEHDKSMHAALFWSIRVKDYEAWRQTPLAQWQEYVATLWPETKGLLQQFTSHADLTFATYRDVALKQFHHENIVFIGDAAHCTSPQLGQGANLALVDALVLSECIAQTATVVEALKQYDSKRRKHLRFYQTASRMLTPFFQSDSWLFAKLRYLTCALPCHIPQCRSIGAQVLIGCKTGIFSKLNPGTWAARYDLRRPNLEATSPTAQYNPR